MKQEYNYSLIIKSKCKCLLCSKISESIKNNNQKIKKMKPQQILINQVQAFLQDQHNIKISIPTLYNLLDSKVNLKILPSPIKPSTMMQNFAHIQSVQYNNQNRYKIIILYIESLLSSSSLDLGAIEAFMTVLNQTINTDIDIMQKNQVVRSNSFKMKEKLHFRIQEISRKTQILTTISQKIHDKSDIINFIAIDIKNYLLSMKLIQNQYQAVKTVQILTPLKIDKIYQFQSSSQQDYHDHYEPLLQVLVRMRANMANLEQAVKNADRIEVPIKSVNLLATCKNLLTELEPFLISNKCSYNRLIFHVVTQQSQNMKLISSFYKHYLDFVKSLVYNVFKCVYLGHLFEGYYKQIIEKIEKERKCIIDLIIRINVKQKEQNYKQIQMNLKNQEQNLEKIRIGIKGMQNIICFGKTSLLQNYLEQKICKKLNYLLIKQEQLQKLQALIQNAKKYIAEVKKLNVQLAQEPKVIQDIQKDIDIIGKDMTLTEKIKIMASEDQDFDKQRQKLFKQDFMKIQEINIRVYAIQHNLNVFQSESTEKKIREEYFPKLYEIISGLKQQISQTQIKLLKSYQSFLEIDEQKEFEAEQECVKIMREITQYLTSQNKLDGSTYASMGGQILNEDQQCNQIKIFLGKIDRAQFLVKGSQKKKKTNSTSQLKKFEMYRKFLEWLLVMFQSSMDENILQNIVDKMDFKEQDEQKVQKNISKVNQLLAQIQKHNKQVLKIIKQIQLRNKNESQKLKGKQKNKKMKQYNSSDEQNEKDRQLQNQNYVYNKIFIIARDRLILYQFIQLMYTQYLSVYLELKVNKNPKSKIKKVQLYEFQAKGVKLFDQKIFEFALLYYHCLNKISMVTKQLNDSNISPKTNNYLNDEIVDPYSTRLNAFLSFNESEMLNLAMRLQKAIHIHKNHNSQIKKWQEIALKVHNKEDSHEQYSKKLKQASWQLQELGVQIQKILKLDKQRIVVHNMEQMKKIYKEYEQYFMIASQIKNANSLQHIGENTELKSEKLQEIIKEIRKNSIHIQ